MSFNPVKRLLAPAWWMDDGNVHPDMVCDPTQGNCGTSDADLQRYRFPALGDFVLSYGNYGHAQSTRSKRNFDVTMHTVSC